MSYLKKGNQLKREGKPKEAIAVYKQAIELNPTFPWYYYELAEILVKNNRLPEALERYQKAIKLNPNCAAFHYGLAKCLLHEGDLGNAIEHLQKAISLKASVTIYHQTLALAYEAESNFEEALRIWQAIAIINPKNAAAEKIHCLQTVVAKNLINQGNVLNRDGKIKEAVNFYQQALALNPQQPLPVYRACGNGLINLGEFEKAETLFQQLKQLYPEIPEGYDGYARIAHYLGDVNLGLKRWQEAITKFPENIGFQVAKGNALINLCQFDEAEAVFQRLIEKYPNQPQGYDGYARIAHALKNWKLALKRWENAIAKLPHYFDFYLSKGNVLVNLLRYQEAEALFEEIIAKYPNRHEGLFYSGILHRRQGNRESALQKFEQVIKNHPHNIFAYYEAAIELKDMKRFAEAEERFQQVLEKNQNYLPALFQGGILASQQGNRELALQRFERIIQYHPQRRIDAYILTITELKRLGRFDEAEEKSKQLSIICSKIAPQTLFANAIFVRKQGNRELALQLFEQITQINPQYIDAYYESAIILSNMGHFKDALKKLDEAYNNNPNCKNNPYYLPSSLNLVQKQSLLTLLLDRVTKEKASTVDNIIFLARLTDEILFRFWGPASKTLAKDADSLLAKLKPLKELFGQYLASQEDCDDFDFNILTRFELAIQILEKESERLKSKEWVRLKLNHSQIIIQSTENFSLDSLESFTNYALGTDEPLEEYQLKAVVKYLPELMDKEKEYFQASIRQCNNSLKLKSQQSIEIFKDFICEPPFSISNGYMVKGYSWRISQQFVNDLTRENTSSLMKHIAQDDENYWIGDPRRFLEEIYIKKKALNNYYEDDVVFGIPTAGHTWGSYQNYGHLLFDQISNLILYEKLNLSCKIFVPQMTDSHWEIFNLLNIPQEKILVKQEYKFKHFIIGRYQWDVEMVNFYRNLRESIMAKCGDIPSEYQARYVYISRRYSHRRPMANEIEVEELMVSLGFSIVYAERLSLEEKAMVMHHTSVVVTPLGTGLLNTIMCHQGTSIVVIYPPDFGIYPYAYKFCAMGGMKLYPLLYEKIANGWIIDIHKLKKVVRALLENDR